MSVTTVTIGGKTVTVTEDTTPRGVWRGDNPDGSRCKVAELPAKGWRFTVQGMMSGSAATHAAALARAEWYVRFDKQHLKPRFALTGAVADAVLDTEYQDDADLLAAYPFEMDPTCGLSTETFLANRREQRGAMRAQLMGVLNIT